MINLTKNKGHSKMLGRLVLSSLLTLTGANQVFAQNNSIMPGLYGRPIDDGVHTLTVTNTSTGSAIVNHQNVPIKIPSICGEINGRFDSTTNYSAPKDYVMDTPLPGTGVCTIIDFHPKPGCEIKCSVAPHEHKFNQTDQDTIVVTTTSGPYPFKRLPEGGPGGVAEIIIEDVMKP